MHQSKKGGERLGKNQRNDRVRYNILTTIIYIVGIILLIQLFNLQIIHGAEYRETSNSRVFDIIIKLEKEEIRYESKSLWWI